jgi:hypothetical protein
MLLARISCGDGRQATRSAVRHDAVMGSSTPFTTPEAEELDRQERLLGELTEQLATKETEFATTGAEFARFRAVYLRRFAPLYAELDRLEAEIAARLALSEATPAAQARAADAEARAADSAKAVEEASESSAGEADQVDVVPGGPAPELRDLYRQAAKMVHPDLVTDEADRARRTKLMAALTEAYATGDADAIRRIVAGEVARPEAITGDDVASNLVRSIRKAAQVRARLTELEQIAGALESDPLFRLFGEVRSVWETGDRDPLAEDEAELRTQIASAQARLAALVMTDAQRGRSVAT